MDPFTHTPRQATPMTKSSTSMIHYQCQECDMTATAVENVASRQAWRDHMLTHSRFLSYRSWTWEVQPLPFV